jgi:hypothetical protein
MVFHFLVVINVLTLVNVIIEVWLHALDTETHVGDEKTRLVKKLAKIKEEHGLIVEVETFRCCDKDQDFTKPSSSIPNHLVWQHQASSSQVLSRLICS